MSEEVGEEATYLDEVVEETPLLFASSETVLTIEDPNLHPIGKATAIFLLFTCLLGFLNGLDYASPTDGLVRPDEFVYRLATAPDDTATFTGSVVDESGPRWSTPRSTFRGSMTAAACGFLRRTSPMKTAASGLRNSTPA